MDFLIFFGDLFGVLDGVAVVLLLLMEGVS